MDERIVEALIALRGILDIADSEGISLREIATCTVTMRRCLWEIDEVLGETETRPRRKMVFASTDDEGEHLREQSRKLEQLKADRKRGGKGIA